MKKLTAFILCAALLLTLVGCAESDTPSDYVDDIQQPDNGGIEISDIEIAGDPPPAVCFDGAVYWEAQSNSTFFAGDAVVSELREGWAFVGEINAVTDERTPSNSGETNYSGYVGSGIYSNPDYPNAVYISCPNGYALFLKQSSESKIQELVMRLEETEGFDIGFEVITETITPNGATFKFTNTEKKTVWFGCNFDITVVIYGSENDIIVPEADVPDGEYTIETGESADVIIDWTRKYGILPDGTYRLYMYPNYTDSQIGNPMVAEFAIGSGEFDTEGIVMTVPAVEN